jgi:hypothetical protein
LGPGLNRNVCICESGHSRFSESTCTRACLPATRCRLSYDSSLV